MIHPQPVPTEGCADGALTFFMQVYRDYRPARRCLEELRRHYPTSRIVVRADGDRDPRYADLAKRNGIEFVGEERLFTVGGGGGAVARMMQLFLQRPTAYLFKIDPDTVIHRRFRYLPAHSGLFGTVQGPGDRRSIQGGCMGFSTGAVDAILGSGLLADPRLRDPQSDTTGSPYFAVLARRARRCGLASFDWTLGWIATELAIPMFPFPEIHSTWDEPVANDDLRFAVTHPRPGPASGGGAYRVARCSESASPGPS